MKGMRLGCAALAAAFLCAACSMPDFSVYPIPESSSDSFSPQTVTLAYPADIDPVVGDALPLLADKLSETTGAAVTLALHESGSTLADFLSGDAQVALLPTAEIAALARGLAFLECPFVFRNQALCAPFLNSSGNGFSDSTALQKALGGTVAAVYTGDSAGLLSVGPLSSDEYLTGCKIAVLAELPGSTVFTRMQADAATEIDQVEIYGAIAEEGFTQGEMFYADPPAQADNITHFYVVDQRVAVWWLVLKTQGDAALPAQTADALRNAAAYLVTPISRAVQQRREDCLTALAGMGIEVIQGEELEYYFYSASDIYAERYSEYGLTEKMYNAISESNF